MQTDLLTELGIRTLSTIGIGALIFAAGTFICGVLYTLFDMLIMPIIDRLWLKSEKTIENTPNTYEKAAILDKQYQRWPHKWGKVKFETQAGQQLSGDVNYGLFNLIWPGQTGTISYKVLRNGSIFITGFIKTK